jgi:hypothetical protein
MHIMQPGCTAPILHSSEAAGRFESIEQTTSRTEVLPQNPSSKLCVLPVSITTCARLFRPAWSQPQPPHGLTTIRRDVGQKVHPTPTFLHCKVLCTPVMCICLPDASCGVPSHPIRHKPPAPRLLGRKCGCAHRYSAHAHICTLYVSTPKELQMLSQYQHTQDYFQTPAQFHLQRSVRHVACVQIKH